MTDVSRNADHIFGLVRMVAIELRSLADNEPEVARPIRYIADQLENEAARLRHAAAHRGSASLNTIRASGLHSSPVALLSSADRSIKSPRAPACDLPGAGVSCARHRFVGCAGTDLERMARYRQQAAQFRQWANEETLPEARDGLLDIAMQYERLTSELAARSRRD